ncbi:MAG: hypothetical protein IPQ02_05395 [Saprospiraceae bacterium]|nr:hypothetical protein [Candidatus Defluviibacterium haderslevense]
MIKRYKPVKEEQQVEVNRLQELKQLKNLANTYLDFYLERQKFPEKKWEKDLSNRNIALLKATINKLNKLQHDDKIAEYLEAIRPTPPLSPNATEEEYKEAFEKHSRNIAITFGQGTNLFILMEINRCSPRLSYFNDLTWFKHGNIREHLDYGIGKVDETVFEKYLPYQVNSIIETKKSFFTKSCFKDDLILLDAVLPLIEEEKFIPSNILIIVLIEGLVRKFALLVYKKQNPEISDSDSEAFAYIKNRSLEGLIKNREWKKDIPFSYSKFVTEYAHTDSPTLTNFEEKFKNHKLANERIEKKLSEFHVILSQQIDNPTLSEEEFKAVGLKHLDGLKVESNYLMNEDDKTVLIGIDVYLDFLAKKFKEDRNSIIHGKYSFFKEKWKTLVYLTALQTLIEKINWYEKNVSSSNA